MEIHEKVREFIKRHLVVFDADEIEFSNNDNIFEKGFVNSLFAMQLLEFIESEFNIQVDSDELLIDNFSTVNNIVRLIMKKKKESKV